MPPRSAQYSSATLDLDRQAISPKGAFGRQDRHPVAHPQKAWVLRIAGTDRAAIPRYRFRAKTDKIVERV